MVVPKHNSSDYNKIIAERRRNSLCDIPPVLVPVWQLKIRERFGINVDKEVAHYIVLAAHERGTWKKQRAIRKIEKLFIQRGIDAESSAKMAKDVINLVVGNNIVEP
ncbi:MAG: hypothetical protein ACYDAO_09270 [Thermoplasmataceae archaeon]